MTQEICKYIIVGGGVAADKAIEGIREYDKNSSILLLAKERHLPYDRPPLTKTLWFGRKKVEDIFVHTQNFYAQNAVKLILDTEITSVNSREKIVTDNKGISYQYEKLLLATGGIPRILSIPGGNLEGIFYYRYLDDYISLKPQAQEGRTVTIIGGGFIGSEMAAALQINKLKVTMVFPDAYIVKKVFPEHFGNAMNKKYIDAGIRILPQEMPVAIAKRDNNFIIKTASGKLIESELVIAGIGIAPEIMLAKRGGLDTANGIMVNSYLQTSNSDIYAAGDNAVFPCEALNQKIRVEHWDNARSQGKCAGRNMAGANERFDYLPYFFSDLFDFSYEAIGDINNQLETFADWQEENNTGIIYYLKDSKVRGVMLCNVWEKVDEARNLILSGKPFGPESLRGIISFE